MKPQRAQTLVIQELTLRTEMLGTGVRIVVMLVRFVAKGAVIIRCLDS